MKGDEEKCLAAGCTTYLTKPIQSGVLLRSVQKYLPNFEIDADELQHVVGIDKKSINESRGVVSTLPLDNPVYREIVEEFVEFLNDHIDEMRDAYAQDDFEQLAELAHGLKGAGGTAGFDVLTTPATDLQRSAAHEDVEHIEIAIEELAELTERITATPQVVE